MKQKVSVWVFTSGSVDSISKESRAVILAEMFPNRIYFFAELVPPIDHDKK